MFLNKIFSAIGKLVPVLMILILVACGSKNEELCSAGSEFYQQGEWAKAVQAFDEYIQSNPDFEKGWLNWNPTFERALTAKGNAHFELGQYEQAIAAYEQSLKVGGSSSADEEANHFNSSAAQYKLENFEAALIALEKVDDKKFKNPAIMLLKADIFSAEAKYDTANFLLSKCLEINSLSGDALIRQVDIKLKKNQKESALALFNKIMGLDGESNFSLFTEEFRIRETFYAQRPTESDSAAKYLAKADELIQKSKFTEAELALQKATPLSKQTFVKMGDVKLATGNIDAAIESYTQALAIDSSYIDGLWKKANALLAKGEKATAEHHYRKANQLDKQNVFTRVALELFFKDAAE